MNKRHQTKLTKPHLRGVRGSSPSVLHKELTSTVPESKMVLKPVSLKVRGKQELLRITAKWVFCVPTENNNNNQLIKYV